MDRKAYIHSKGLISITGHSLDPGFWQDPVLPTSYPYLAQEPTYEGMISPNQKRRLSKVVRMGLGAAFMALRGAGLEKPDMVSTGTFMGCVHDTEQFLSQMVKFEEQKLSPTAFIQSTHNTVGGQIALATGCLGQNLCYVQRGHSFEQAWLDASLWLASNPGSKALVGGMDEVGALSVEVFQYIGLYRKDPEPPAHGDGMLQGSRAGEGAGFFVVSDTPPAAGAKVYVNRLEIFSASHGEQAIEKWKAFANPSQKTPPDLILSGQDGRADAQPFYDFLSQTMAGVPQYFFKSITGDYGTASALALGLAHQIFEGKFPGIEQGRGPKAPCRRIMMVNEHWGDYSFWELMVEP